MTFRWVSLLHAWVPYHGRLMPGQDFYLPFRLLSGRIVRAALRESDRFYDYEPF